MRRRTPLREYLELRRLKNHDLLPENMLYETDIPTAFCFRRICSIGKTHRRASHEQISLTEALDHLLNYLNVRVMRCGPNFWPVVGGERVSTCDQLKLKSGSHLRLENFAFMSKEFFRGLVLAMFRGEGDPSAQIVAADLFHVNCRTIYQSLKKFLPIKEEEEAKGGGDSIGKAQTVNLYMLEDLDFDCLFPIFTILSNVCGISNMAPGYESRLLGHFERFAEFLHHLLVYVSSERFQEALVLKFVASTVLPVCQQYSQALLNFPHIVTPTLLSDFSEYLRLLEKAAFPSQERHRHIGPGWPQPILCPSAFQWHARKISSQPEKDTIEEQYIMSGVARLADSDGSVGKISSSKLPAPHIWQDIGSSEKLTRDFAPVDLQEGLFSIGWAGVRIASFERIRRHQCRIPQPKYEGDWYNKRGLIDQSEARATSQPPSIRVRHAGHAAHYILLLNRVLLWLAAYLPRMPLEHRETQDWLRPDGPICLRPDPTSQPDHTTCRIPEP
ncbi:unnamed protein product [Mesocestoides corti]|uniref:Uncharacterized protein n=1 Tax=Mesocestoides corti TaxID=53468 RepID=A0A0R3UFJ7_MESCO|nr:unnamed protein product [Mesocestoides corti]